MNDRRLEMRAARNGFLICLPLFVLPAIAEFFEDRAPWVSAAARISLFLGLAGVAGYSALIMRTQRELERLVMLEAAAVALCAVLGTALVYAALHELDLVSPPTPWVFWNVGLIGWSLGRLILTRLRT